MGERTTAREKLPYPSETGQVHVGNVDFEELADRLDAIMHPPGDIRITGNPTLAEGWLKCEGQEVSRTTYKALFEAIGTAYGSGNGVTTFNLPNFMGADVWSALSSIPFNSLIQANKFVSLECELRLTFAPGMQYSVEVGGVEIGALSFNAAITGNATETIFFEWPVGKTLKVNANETTRVSEAELSTKPVRPFGLANVWIRT